MVLSAKTRSLLDDDNDSDGDNDEDEDEDEDEDGEGAQANRLLYLRVAPETSFLVRLFDIIRLGRLSVNS